MAGSTRRPLGVAGPAGLLYLLMLWSAAAVPVPAPAPVPVGVVLDLTSETGRKSLTCISMALDDFYAARANSTTRVELRVRDSRGEVVAAAYAVEAELFAGDHLGKVQAMIISPETSPEAELFANLAKRSNIPILSFSATSLASIPSQARFFVHSAANTNSQASPIAAILGAFEWHAAVLLHEESTYGISIVSALVHEFQGQGHHVRGIMDSVAVPVDATDSRLDAVLLAVRNMPARVVVVHVTSALAVRLFRRALAAGMVSEGYVWIATSAVGDAADSLSPGNIDCLQGVVSLRVHMQATEQVRNFSRRFKQRFRQENPATHDTVSVPVWLLWLYDTTWATATAAEMSFRPTAQAAGTALVDAVLSTRFHGLAGSFRLVDGQLQIPAYEIVNIIGTGARTVGFWTPEFGISTSLYPRGGKELKQILWPGETAVVPIGWSESPNGRPLRVAVPVKRGFSQFVNISGDPRTGREIITGYCVDVFHAATARLSHPVAYQYVPVSDNSESYDTLVNLVHEKRVDVVVADVTITASRMKLVSFTVPFAESGWSMIMAEEAKSNNMWIFVKPLTPLLWLACIAFFFFTGFVVWVIEHRINPRFPHTSWKEFGVLLYKASSALVFSQKEKLKSNISKLVVVISMFAAFILTTCYTASLTSMLTVQPLQRTISILGERDYVGYQQGSFIADFLINMGFHEAKLRGYTTTDEYADALRRGSENGGVSAIFDEMPYLRLFLSRYCQGYSLVGPTYKSAGFGFVFPMGSPLALDVSRAILELAEEEKLARIENKWFAQHGVCANKNNSTDSSFRLDLNNFGGLFLISVVVSCLMLLVHLATCVAMEPGGAPPLLSQWLLRFDSLQRRRDEFVANGGGAAERNPRPSAAGETEQEAAVTTGSSETVRNSASSPVPEEIVALPPARSIERVHQEHASPTQSIQMQPR